MAIEKSIYNMPSEVDDDIEVGAVVDMAIATDEDMPVMVELDDGGVEISFGEEPPLRI